jgi:hypothetical protein
MPIDYDKYHKDWFSDIRPRILKRAGNRCEFCGVPNHELIYRGYWNGREVYQTSDGNIYDAGTSELLTNDIYADIEPLNGKDKAIKVVLTVAHLNHDVKDNRDENLRALCQRCHLRYDAKHHAYTRNRGDLTNQLKLDL